MEENQNEVWKMINLKEQEIWFGAGSQLLYGSVVLETVAKRGQEIVSYINANKNIPCKFVCKGTMKSNEEVTSIVKQANYVDNCFGIVSWCHTFSPSKMWFNGLNLLQKSCCHFTTQYNVEIQNEEIDMDFMNLNQAAHGDREHGFIGTRMRLHRKVIVGYWKDERVLKELGEWMRAAVGYDTIMEASLSMARLRAENFLPNFINKTIDDQLFSEYEVVYDYFGREKNDIMKRLKDIKLEQAR